MSDVDRKKSEKARLLTYKISCNFDRVARVFLLSMVLIIVANVVLRKIGYPIYGTPEIVSLLFGVVIAFAIGRCTAEDANPAVKLVTSRMPPRARKLVHTVTGIFSIVLFGLVIWQCIASATVKMLRGDLTATMGLPGFIIVYLIGVGLFLLIVVLVFGLQNE